MPTSGWAQLGSDEHYRHEVLSQRYEAPYLPGQWAFLGLCRTCTTPLAHDDITVMHPHVRGPHEPC